MQQWKTLRVPKTNVVFMKKLEINDRNDSSPTHTHFILSVLSLSILMAVMFMSLSHQFPKCFLIVHTILTMDSDLLVLYPVRSQSVRTSLVNKGGRGNICLGLEFIKHFSCSNQLSMKFMFLIFALITLFKNQHHITHRSAIHFTIHKMNMVPPNG